MLLSGGAVILLIIFVLCLLTWRRPNVAAVVECSDIYEAPRQKSEKNSPVDGRLDTASTEMPTDKCPIESHFFQSSGREIFQYREQSYVKTGGLGVFQREGEEALDPEAALPARMLVTDYKLSRFILKHNNDFPKPPTRGIHKVMLGASCTQSNGETLKRQREVLKNVLSAPHLNDTYLPVIKKHAGLFLKSLESCAESGDYLDLQDAFSDLSGHIMLEILLGDQGLELLDLWLVFWHVMRTPYGKRGGEFYHNTYMTYFEMQKILDRLYDERLAALSENEGEQPNSFMDLLIMQQLVANKHDASDVEGEENQACLSREEIQGNIWSFLTAGYETVAGSLTLASYCLFAKTLNEAQALPGAAHEALSCAEYDALRERLYQEHSAELLDLDARGVMALKQTYAVVMETLRLYPPVLNMVRFVSGADTETGAEAKEGCPFQAAAAPADSVSSNTEKTVVKGAGVTELPPELAQLIERGHRNILCDIVALQRDASVWADPQRFDPQRWITGKGAKPFLAFGVGEKSCIGQQLAMVEVTYILASFLKHYEVTLAEDFMPRFTQTPTLRLENGLVCKVHRL